MPIVDIQVEAQKIRDSVEVSKERPRPELDVRNIRLTNNPHTVEECRKAGMLAVAEAPLGVPFKDEMLSKRFRTYLVLPPGGGVEALVRALEWKGAHYLGVREGEHHFIVPKDRCDIGRWFVGEGDSVLKEITRHTRVLERVLIEDITYAEFLKRVSPTSFSRTEREREVLERYTQGTI